MDGILSMPCRVQQIDLIFDIDADSILNISTIEKSTEKENKITITNHKGILNQKEIHRVIDQIERCKAQDEHKNQNIILNLKINLENY